MRERERVRATAGTFGTAGTIETGPVEEIMIGSGTLTKQIAGYLARTGFDSRYPSAANIFKKLASP
jgi:hypothetical protein